MSFGNLKIYPFPAVQYIPLPLTDLGRGTILKSNLRTRQPQLLVGAEVAKWYDVLRNDYGIALNNVTKMDAFPIMALNLEIDDVKYRSFYITMTGRRNNGFYQYCTVPKKYFYKKNLFFELFDTETAERITAASTILK